MQARIMLAAPFSNSGKTLLTLSLHQALQHLGYKTVSFKVGPDYLDPQVQRQLLGIRAYNLDAFFLKPEPLRAIVARADGDLGIIEGAMGFYDGLGDTTRASSYDIACITKTPVIMVVDAQKMGLSLAALLHGFQHYRQPSQLCGVIFNRVSQRRYLALKDQVEALGLRCLGYFPQREEAHLTSRYLGLEIPPKELMQDNLAALGHQAGESLDLEGIVALAKTAEVLPEASINPQTTAGQFHLAIARDDAFSFLYQENLDFLESLGARLHAFSPLRDHTLLPEADALYLPSGYPERFAPQLSHNYTLLAALKDALHQGLPCIAEGGGMLYLQQTLEGEAMVGYLPGEARREERRQGFGYHYLIPQRDSLIGIQGQPIPSRRFHYCSSSEEGRDYRFEKLSTGEQGCSGYASDTLYASFFSLCFPGLPAELTRFQEAALAWQKTK